MDVEIDVLDEIERYQNKIKIYTMVGISSIVNTEITDKKKIGIKCGQKIDQRHKLAYEHKAR